MDTANDWVISGFYFAVSIIGESNSDIAFQEITGLEKEMNIEEVVCGGENRFKYRLPTTTSFKNLILKGGVSDLSSPLSQWCVDTIDSDFSKPIVTKDISINLLNPDGKISLKWVFHNAYPVKWSGSELNSEKNSVFLKTIELAYQNFNINDAEKNFDKKQLFGEEK